MGFSRQEYWSGLPFPSPNPKERQCPKWSNQDTAVLISHVSKVMLNILQAKLQQYVNQELLDVPARCFKKRQRNQRSKCQHLLDHGESQGAPKENERKRKWSRSVVSDSLRSHGLWPTRLLCPWDSPGKSTGVGCHSLQGIYPTQGSYPSPPKKHLITPFDCVDNNKLEKILKEMVVPDHLTCLLRNLICGSKSNS